MEMTPFQMNVRVKIIRFLRDKAWFNELCAADQDRVISNALEALFMKLHKQKSGSLSIREFVSEWGD